MKKFKLYESYADGSTVLKSQGILDNLGRTIREEVFVRGSEEISKVRDIAYTDENGSCVITLSHPGEFTIDGYPIPKSVITEKYENFPYGIGIVYSSFATIYRDNHTEVESTTFEYDKYGCVLLSCINTNPDQYSYKRFAKYFNDDTDVVTIYISDRFDVDCDQNTLTEEELGFDRTKIVFDKRINKILSYEYRDKYEKESNETLYKYDFSVTGDNAFIQIMTDKNNNTRIEEFNGNGDIIRDRIVQKNPDGSIKLVEYFSYEYNGELLVRMTYSYEGTKNPEPYPEKAIVGRYYEYSDMEEDK